MNRFPRLRLFLKLIALVLSFVIGYYSLTDWKDIHISNDSDCTIEVVEIRANKNFVIGGKINKKLQNFETMCFRHFGNQFIFLIDLNVDDKKRTIEFDAEKNSYLYDSKTNSIRGSGDVFDSIDRNTSRLRLTNELINCSKDKGK